LDVSSIAWYGRAILTGEFMKLILAGAPRFKDLFAAMDAALTLSGHTVLRTIVADADDPELGKAATEANARKLMDADGVVILNAHAYIDADTLACLQCARDLGKTIYVLESWGLGCGIGRAHNEAARAAARSFDIPENYGSPVDLSHSRRDWYQLLPGAEDRANRIRFIELVRTSIREPKE
jgi:hypothetical protein